MMQTIRNIFHFHGGLQLDEHKSISTSKPIQDAPIPSMLVLPLLQHIGQPARPIVNVGDKVLKGQVIAEADGRVSAPVHASSSGTVIAIEPRDVPHASGLKGVCIVIETDGHDNAIATNGLTDFTTVSPDDIRARILESGIVGLGGAGFPSFIKLDPGKFAVETLILNAAECEPYITCDDMLMRERAEDVINGARIMQYALHAKHCIIGIEDNKIDAHAALQQALAGSDDIELVRVPSRYPAGGEKQMIYTLTGKQVPSHTRPLELGIICHNVGTAAAVFRAIMQGEPLVSRTVTLTGSAIPQPRNIQVRIGTPITELLSLCHANEDDIDRIMIGGPMMGFDLPSSDAPVTKTCNCVLATHKRDRIAPQASMPCIRCGECANVCPANLLPQQLYWHARAQEFDHIQDYHLFDCIECGCCDVVCPSHIPLVQFFRFAKTTIWQQERDKEKSDKARVRHEFRLERLEREKQEKRERHNRKKAALKKDSEKGDDPKKAAILAAMKRVQDKKSTAQPKPKNMDNLTAEQQELIKQADKRRADNQTAEKTETDKSS